MSAHSPRCQTATLAQPAHPRGHRGRAPEAHPLPSPRPHGPPAARPLLARDSDASPGRQPPAPREPSATNHARPHPPSDPSTPPCTPAAASAPSERHDRCARLSAAASERPQAARPPVRAGVRPPRASKRLALCRVRAPHQLSAPSEICVRPLAFASAPIRTRVPTPALPRPLSRDAPALPSSLSAFNSPPIPVPRLMHARSPDPTRGSSISQACSPGSRSTASRT